jgi:hypothetical protein
MRDFLGFPLIPRSMHIENYFIDAPEKQNYCIFKGGFHNRTKAAYEDKNIYEKNKCFTLVSPLPKKKGPALLRSLCCW